jgi:hypothetical protein
MRPHLAGHRVDGDLVDLLVLVPRRDEHFIAAPPVLMLGEPASVRRRMGVATQVQPAR